MAIPAANALATLLALRKADEDAASSALARALVRRMEAEAKEVSLRATAQWAWSRLAERLREEPGTQRAADALTRTRFLDRLRAESEAYDQAVDAFRRDHLEPDRRAEAAAQTAYTRAHQRREVVERAIARRAEARRREVDRRTEAAADDVGRRR